MTKPKKLAVVFAGMICIVLTMLLPTELRVQAAKRHLRNSSKVSECISEFGEPSGKASDDCKRVLAERLGLKLGAGDQVLSFNKEGLPYWAIYVVTSDGERIKDSAVDRFW